MAHDTWLKLWRKSEHSAAFTDSGLWHVWCWCLIRAAHMQVHVPVRTGEGNTIVTLEPGQLIYGRNAAAKALKMPPSTVERRILRLTKLGNLVRQPDTHWSIITVVNWQLYNGGADQSGQATGQAPDRHRTGTGHIQEVKEGKEVKKEASSAREALQSVDILLPGGRTAMMMLPSDATAQQKAALTELLADVFRDSDGPAVVAAVLARFNQRMPDGDLAHPIAYLRTLVDDLGPKVRRQAQEREEQAADEVERDQDRQEREAEDERKRTDPQVFRQAVEAHARRSAIFRGMRPGAMPPDEARKDAAAVLCHILGITEPPAGWEDHDGLRTG